MVTFEQFVKDVHSALGYLYEPDRLRRSALASLLGIANRPDTFSALQRILIDAVKSLEPEGDEPQVSYAWEVFEPLFYRYVHQLGQEHVARQLGMSVRHLRRKEHAALEVLASRLWAQFGLQDQLGRQGSTEAASAQPMQASPSVNDELAWLESTAPQGPADLNQMLPEVLHLLEGVAAQYSVSLEVASHGVLPGLAVHEVALRQALLNLLGVAIHAACGGSVSVSARPGPLQVEIRVQAHAAVSDKPAVSDGDQSSLQLAHRLADLCGGRLTTADDAPAADVVLTLPILEQMPILVIDDNADTQQLLRRYVTGSRYRLITTGDGEEALRLAVAFAPKVIVLDVMMPSLDGWRVLAHLRQHPATECTPIVVCTILAQEELARSLGASGYVQKPVTRHAFLAALDRQVTLTETGSR